MIQLLILLATLLQSTSLAEIRSRAAVHRFEVMTGHPKGWPGHVVDHKIPLCLGGPDTVDNYQWQTDAASYRKDGFERTLCAEMKRQGYVLTKVQPEEK